MTTTTVYPTPDNKFIHADHAKYGSGLLIVADTDSLPSFPYSRCVLKDCPAYCGMIKVIDADLGCYYGTFFLTKKGKPAFRVNSKGPHALIHDSFSGCYGYTSNIDRLKDADRLYYKRSLSNGGGAGDIYAVIDRNLRATFDVDDL